MGKEKFCDLFDHDRMLVHNKKICCLNNDVANYMQSKSNECGNFFSVMLEECVYNKLVDYVNDSCVNFIFFLKRDLRQAAFLLWDCPSVEAIICVDSKKVFDEKERVSKLNNKKIWDYNAINSTDNIEWGGWFNSYTHQKFSQKEMDEYISNTMHKLTPYLNEQQKVIEIGCASGLTMYNVAPRVKEYHGVDMSTVTINKHRKLLLSEQTINNIHLHEMKAHEVSEIGEKDFQLAILNSVIHCFDGYIYLIRVLIQVISLLGDFGVIFLGDIIDSALRNDFEGSLCLFSKTNPGSNTKTNLSEELMVNRSFWNNLQYIIPQVSAVEISNKIGVIDNELLRYRYDVIIHIEKKVAVQNVIDGQKRIYSYDLDDRNNIIMR